VLDCSVALAWYFPDENDTYANAVLDSFEDNRAVAPSIWTLEFLNAFVVAERRGRVTADHTTQCLTQVLALPIEHVLWNPEGTANRLLDLARIRNLSAYDASYLELAQRLALPLATLDEKLRSAAQVERIGLYKP
jgi:predicted nucleic acid-binding protein